MQPVAHTPPAVVPGPPIVHPGAKPGGNRWKLLLFGLMLLVLSTLSVGCQVAARAFELSKFHEWPQTVGIYDGMSSQTTSSGRNRTVSCTRHYLYDFHGEKMRGYADSHCVVVVGLDPKPGSKVTVAYQPVNGRTCLSEVEVYGVGGTLALSFGMMVLSAILSIAGLMVGMRRRA